jgi:PAS domain S-box-containing protein
MQSMFCTDRVRWRGQGTLPSMGTSKRDSVGGLAVTDSMVVDVDTGDLATSVIGSPGSRVLEPDPAGPATIAADDDNRIIAVNDAAGRLLGWDPDQLRGRRLVAVIPEAWREHHVTGFTEFLLTGHSRIIGTQVRLPALRHDGSVIEANVGPPVGGALRGPVSGRRVCWDGEAGHGLVGCAVLLGGEGGARCGSFSRSRSCSSWESTRSR